MYGQWPDGPLAHPVHSARYDGMPELSLSPLVCSQSVVYHDARWLRIRVGG